MHLVISENEPGVIPASSEMGSHCL